jgi:REP element-mobilizing transposase RayT
LHAFARQPIVFVTAVTERRRVLLACADAHRILRAVWEKSAAADGWFVGRYVLMPDHVHLFARAAHDAKSLAGWIRTWKSVSSRLLATQLGVAAPVWQKDYFDRFLRSADDYGKKWEYIRQNPVRKALAASAGEWPWAGVIHDLEF